MWGAPGGPYAEVGGSPIRIVLGWTIRSRVGLEGRCPGMLGQSADQTVLLRDVHQLRLFGLTDVKF